MTSPEVEISRAQIVDAAEILALQKLAYLSEAKIYNDYSLPPLTQTLPELAAELEHSLCLKAMRAGRIVGSVRARLEGGACQIGRLIVHPDRQGRGLGQSLMAAIEAEFPQAERFQLFTGSLSERNLRIYAKLGYRPLRTQEVSPGLSLVFLEKPGQA